MFLVCLERKSLDGQERINLWWSFERDPHATLCGLKFFNKNKKSMLKIRKHRNYFSVINVNFSQF